MVYILHCSQQIVNIVVNINIFYVTNKHFEIVNIANCISNWIRLKQRENMKYVK